MLRDRTIGVVVPAYNEELLIRGVLETMPAYVDQVFVVNDGSRDRTGEIVQEIAQGDPRIVPIDHETNRGLGQSLIDGYLEARRRNVDVVAVMAGDGQMNPDDLERVVTPILDGRVDYVKGNRLLRDDVVMRMPRHRYLGNAALTLLTKFATGYWRIIDPQCGYTAISRAALATIPIETMIRGYGYNAHILNMLNLNNFKVVDVEVEPVYGEERSKIKLRSYIPRVSWLLLRLFLKRLVHKYLVREFHPLIFFYAFGVFNGIAVSVPLLVRFVYLYAKLGVAPATTLILLNFSATFALFSIFFAMWMDMEDNRRLMGE